MKSTKHSVEVSVICTGFNEGRSLKKNLERMRDLPNTSRYSWEMILYDDKSKDQTPKIFREFASKYKNVHAYFHKKNVGRGGTVIDAIEKSKGVYVGYIDTDLELSPVYLFEFLKELENGADVVIATRFYTVGATNLIRAIMSKGYIFLIHHILGLHFKDTEAGFKFFNRKKITPIIHNVKDKRWFFDTEVVARSYLAGLKVSEVPVVYIRDPKKISSVKLAEDTIDYAKKLWNFRAELRKEYANRLTHS